MLYRESDALLMLMQLAIKRPESPINIPELSQDMAHATED